MQGKERDIVTRANIAGKKARGERGASIIIALVFLLVCATVATLVLSGASVNSDRTKKETSEQQGYFALNSALNEAKSMWETEEPMKSLVVTISGTSVTASPSTYPSSAITAWAVQQAANVTAGSTTTPLTVTVTGTNPTSGEALPDVTLKYTMNTGYAIEVEGSVDSGSGYVQTLTTTIKATVGTSTPKTVDWKTQS